MTRLQYQERKRRYRSRKLLRKAIKGAIYLLLVLICVLVIRGGIGLVKKIAGHLHREEPEVTVEEEMPAEGDTASKKALSSPEIGDPGWNIDETGWWYKNSDGTQYADGWKTIDGQKYYFTETGYLPSGWVEIDGEDHFFNESGIEDPDAHLMRVALTYDDGPSENTDKILDALEAHGAKATFFVVGTQAEYYTAQLQREADLGMEIGNHTYDHDTLYGASGEFIQETLEKNKRVIKDLCGVEMEIMRPTGGGFDETVRNNVGAPMIIWDVDTLDWSTKDADNTYNVIMNEVQDGSVILMHDLWKATAEAAERIIVGLQEKGYKLVTVSELARAYGYDMQDGVPYYSFPADGSGDTHGFGEESTGDDTSGDTENSGET